MKGLTVAGEGGGGEACGGRRGASLGGWCSVVTAVRSTSAVDSRDQRQSYGLKEALHDIVQ